MWILKNIPGEHRLQKHSFLLLYPHPESLRTVVQIDGQYTSVWCSHRLFCEWCSLELGSAQLAQWYMVGYWALTQCLVPKRSGGFQGFFEWHSTSWSGLTYILPDTNTFLNSTWIFQTLCPFFMCQLYLFTLISVPSRWFPAFFRSALL